jgi:rod shape-determining protein MreB
MEDNLRNDGYLYIGIDAGIFKTSICTSDGIKFSERSIVAFSGDSTDSTENAIYGNEVLELSEEEMKNYTNSSLSLDNDNFKHFLTHLLEKNGIDPGKNETYAIIGVSPAAETEYKRNLLNLCRNIFTGAMVVDDVFCIVYSKGLPEGSMVVDIGYNRTNVCVITKNVTQEVDCLSLASAGKDIDRELFKLINERWPDSRITEELVRKWKEEHGHLVSVPDACVVDIPFEILDENEPEKAGEIKTTKGSISEEIQLACEFVVTDIVSGITRVLSDSEAEMHNTLRNNIHLSGGTSRLPGINNFIEGELRELGGGKVFLDPDPEFAVPEGALEIAKNMPPEFWKEVLAVNCNKEMIL